MNNNLSINNNINTKNTYLHTKRKDEEQEKASKKLATGNRNEQTGNDSASLAISQKLVSQIDGLDQASKNSQDGISAIQTAEGGLSIATEMVQRARDLTLQASNGIYTDSQKDMINQELSQITEGISDVVKNTSFNEKNLLNGENPELLIQTGANAEENMSIDLSSSDLTNLNIITGDFDVKGNTSEILDALNLDLETIATGRADLGSQSNRLTSTVNNNDTYAVNLSRANSTLSDTDIAKESSNLSKSKILRAAQMNILMQEQVQKESVMRILS